MITCVRPDDSFIMHWTLRQLMRQPDLRKHSYVVRDACHTLCLRPCQIIGKAGFMVCELLSEVHM
jgi:hypothetical protein